MSAARRWVVAVDQGTTNTKAVLVDQRGTVVTTASEAVRVAFPRPGWVEQDPLEIWEATRRALARCLGNVDPGEVAAVGITNQRESVVAWDRSSGQPLGPLVSWQCTRSAPLCNRLRAAGLEALVRTRTGLRLEPMFSAGKMRWLLDVIPFGQQRAENGEVCLGTVDTWLLWRLTGGRAFCTDVTNASRTALFRLDKLEWDPELLDWFGIPRAALPEVRPSSAWYGELAALDGLPPGIPVASLIGDSHAALFGHGAPKPGWVKATYGTGTSLLGATPGLPAIPDGLVGTVAWADGGVVYGLEGNIPTTGAAVQWMERVLGLGGPEQLTQLAAEVEDAGGVYFVPALAGLGSPWWDDQARGLITGITRGTDRAHLARATLEAVAFQVRDVFDTMVQGMEVQPEALLVDGGASRNDFLMQLQADLLGRPVWRNNCPETSALGAAYLAGLAVGMWSSVEEIRGLPRCFTRFEPHLPADVVQERLEAWRDAVARARTGSGRAG